MSLASHPRLYISQQAIDRLQQPPRDPALKAANRQVRALADHAVHVADVEYPRDTHNEHLLRARVMQKHVVTLLVRWAQTGDRCYRDAVVRHVRSMGEWTYWSWIMWRQGNADPHAIFDLSYGENSATLAVAYTWLHETLSDEERALFLGIARERSLTSFLHQIVEQPADRRPGWFMRATSNWNTVCAGGAGMLALAMHEDLPEAAQVLPLAEQSIAPFMQALDKTDGAWPEGIGYWNYGMRYAFMYLLSHENATGRPHPLLHREGTRATLRFPLAFCPNGVPCSFGDVNRWHPLPFHYAAAARLGADDVLALLDRRSAAQQRPVTADGPWPDAAEMLLLHPRRQAETGNESRKPVTMHYTGQDWAVLADRMPEPSRYLAIRGGTTEVPHGHLDLLSFHCVVGDESMITNLTPHEYLDTTFSPRRWELFEMTPPSKNTLLINGVGIVRPASVDMTPIQRRGAVGFHLEASQAMGVMRDGPAVKACSRTFLMLHEQAFLILDQVELPHPGKLEARLHTLADATPRRDGAELAGQRQNLSIRFAANVPASVHRADAPMTTPDSHPTTLRWCSDRNHKSFTFVTLLCPGRSRPRLAIKDQPRQVAIEVSGRGWQWDGRFRKPAP